MRNYMLMALVFLSVGCSIQAFNKVTALRQVASLSRAICDKNMKVVQELANADVINKKDEYGLTPLYYAIAYRNNEAFELLMSLGADMNVSSVREETLLHTAIRTGNETAFNRLLALGFDVDAADKKDSIMGYAECYAKIEFYMTVVRVYRALINRRNARLSH